MKFGGLRELDELIRISGQLWVSDLSINLLVGFKSYKNSYFKQVLYSNKYNKGELIMSNLCVKLVETNRQHGR